MEEGGRDKAPLQPQQPPATAPSGADEKSSGKERRDAGDKDKEQELVRRGWGPAEKATG
jgi:26S proteasome regulatory subunit N1